MSRGRVSIAVLFLKQAANACEVIARWDRMGDEISRDLFALNENMRAMAKRLEKF